MKTFETVIEAGPDQTLHFDIPVEETGRRYHVIVIFSEDSHRDGNAPTLDQWPDQFIERTAGAWQGDLERPH